MVTKRIAAAGIAVVLAVVPAFPAMAHGHGQYHRREVPVYTAPAQTDGQTANGCPVCTAEWCEELGHHFHDDVEYCGYSHACGYCDGTCGYCEGTCGYMDGTCQAATDGAAPVCGGLHGHHR